MVTLHLIIWKLLDNLLFIFLPAGWKWKSLSRVWLFATPWAIQYMEFSRPKILEWVAVPFSRGSSQSRDRTQVYLYYRQIIYQLSHKRSPESFISSHTTNTGSCLTFLSSNHRGCEVASHFFVLIPFSVLVFKQSKFGVQIPICSSPIIFKAFWSDSSKSPNRYFLKSHNSPGEQN